jgi:hypothetical protein
VAGENGGVEAGYVKEEGRHLFVLGFEAIGDLSGDADLVLASQPETLGLVGDLHEEPHALFLRGGVCFDHFNETGDFRSERVYGCRKDCVELAKVGELTRDICGEGV